MCHLFLSMNEFSVHSEMRSVREKSLSVAELQKEGMRKTKEKCACPMTLARVSRLIQAPNSEEG